MHINTIHSKRDGAGFTRGNTLAGESERTWRAIMWPNSPVESVSLQPHHCIQDEGGRPSAPSTSV